ncbi:MAG: sulfatase [Candidatus Hydrogenedentota bacterium]|nr:MAG: sulfatase [Candidatus Hydrogenedentota bacterium]
MNNDIESQWLHNVTRRQFFKDCGVGVGKIALASLLCSPRIASAATAVNPLAAKPPHFAPKAKRVIFLFMAGAPSQLDLFDNKPVLRQYDGTSVPESIIKDQRYAFINSDASLMASPFSFSKHGESGAELSEMLPHLSAVVDELAIIKSVHTDQFNHAPAQIFFNTGSPQLGRPSMGSWVTYGLGSEAEELPGFVVLSSGRGTSGGASNWGCGFMPALYQGVPFRSTGDPILNLANPPGYDDSLQRDSLDLLNGLNRHRMDQVGDPTIASRIQSYELAYKMQSSAPEAVDLSKESPATLERYGAKPGESSFANNCLLARRLLERGVRFVNCYHASWDHHSDVEGGLRIKCGETDQAAAALIADLKERGMLDDTLVIWGGEFGRTPMVESSAALGRSRGRDHHPQAFTMWMAGGGVKPGMTLGATDELGMQITDRPVHVHDIQATILHLLGLDHERLTYRFQGREFRLTDVSGEVVHELLA